MKYGLQQLLRLVPSAGIYVFKSDRKRLPEAFRLREGVHTKKTFLNGHRPFKGGGQNYHNFHHHFHRHFQLEFDSVIRA